MDIRPHAFVDIKYSPITFRDVDTPKVATAYQAPVSSSEMETVRQSTETGLNRFDLVVIILPSFDFLQYPYLKVNG